MTREDAQALDAADPLRGARGRFHIPDGTIYLDGNSLGAMPRAVSANLAEVVEGEWGEDLVSSWNKHHWIDAPTRVAAKIAPLIGVQPHELLIADSTSICLFKLLAAAVAARPGRTTILTETGNFPADLYVAQGLVALFPQLRLKRVAADEIEPAIDADTAVVFLTHVDYRSGARHDMSAINAAASARGALTLWDLSHSAGAIAVDCSGTGGVLAVGCGYKYLNGGPGAPAFLFIAERLLGELRSPLPGWMAHAEPFAFEPNFRATQGIAGFLTGTPSILAIAALEAGLDSFEGLAITDIEAKAEALTQYFIAAVEERCGKRVRLASPRDPARRGSHVSFAHPDAYAVMQALIARGIIGDFRAPDLMRFGFAPLYNSFADGLRAAEALADILDSGEWDQPRFKERARVT
jgi:kynureninase